MAHTLLFRRLVRLFQRARTQNLRANGQPRSIPKSRGHRHWSRRRFMKTTALATGSAIATRLISAPQVTAQHVSGVAPTIAIIGGGIAGLTAAYQLKKQGYTATVYEARNRLGGRMHSINHHIAADLVVDVGGTFINSDHEDIITLVNELGLSLFDRSAYVSSFDDTMATEAYYFDGRLFSDAELVELLRPLAAQITADADLLDEDYESYAPTIDAQSVADYLILHQDKITSPAVYDLLLGGIRSEYGVDFEESSALQLLFMLPTVDGDRVETVSSDEAYLIEGGSSKLINALSDQLTDQIRLRTPLVQLEQSTDGRYTLAFKGYPPVVADYVILAIPFNALRQVELKVELPELLQQFIQEVDLGHNEKVIAGFKGRPWHTQKVFATEVWSDLDASLIWDASQRQRDHAHAALTFFIGGSETEAARLGAKRQGEQFVQQLEAIVPGLSEAVIDRYLRTFWSQDPYSQGSYVNFKPGQLTTFWDYFYVESDDPEERVDVHEGNLVFAGEHLSDEFYGFMNAGAQTGRLAANVVMTLMATSES